MAFDTKRTDPRGLESLALQQGGYFDRRDAHMHGIGDRLLHHYVHTDRFERLFPGVYRLQHAPVATHDELLQALVWTNYRGAVSHDSALSLYGLSDVMPARVHLTVPPEFRRSNAPFMLHRAVLEQSDVADYDGVRVTTPARSIVDATSAGLDPEQVVKAVRQALDRALLSPEHLRTIAGRPRYKHRRVTLPLIEGALRRAAG